MKKDTVVCRDRHGNAEEVAVDVLEPRASVYGVIVKDDKVLLSREWDGYDFPGGGIDKGETFDEALEREVREETGINVKRDKLLHATTNFFKTSSGRFLQGHLIYYRCDYVSGDISTEWLTDEEKEFMQAAEWVPLDSLKKIAFYNAVDSEALIHMAIEGKGV